MNKLTEIKEAINTLNKSDWKLPWQWGIKKRTKGDGECKDNEFGVGDLISPINDKSSNTILEVQRNKYNQPEIYCWNETAADLIVNAPEYITYLLSLIEEKDKALQEIIEAYDEGEQYFSTVRKMTRIARKALNTSSNSEGDI